jgi:transcriptional regulator with XRE-family HTH domain
MTENDLKAILSKNLRRFRGYHKLSQADFAEKIKISIPFLSDIENGKKWVSPVTLAKMADVFNVEAYELLKPETIIPDNTGKLLEKYTAEVYKVFGDSLDVIKKNYLEQINKLTV